MTDQPQDQTFYVPERALVIAAHADDIEFAAAGTVARWADAGAQVTYCIVTDNGAGSNDPNTNLEELVHRREREQRAAAEVVGVHDVRFLGYRDGVLEPTMQLRRDLTLLIREIRPQVVMTFDPSVLMAQSENYVNHPDHVATGTATLYAVFPSAGARPIFPELLAEGYEPHNVARLYLFLTERPNLFVDISDVHARKIEALRCHASQLDDAALEMVSKWDAEAGKQAGYACAEVFRVMNFERGPVA